MEVSMRIFIYRENHQGILSLGLQCFCEEILIVAEDIDAAKEILFQVCFFGRGNHDQCADGGDGYFPHPFDYFGDLERWEDDCREIFFDTGSSVAYIWDNDDGCLMATGFEALNIDPGIYIRTKGTINTNGKILWSEFECYK
jgi:hypothetical protein